MPGCSEHLPVAVTGWQRGKRAGTHLGFGGKRYYVDGRAREERGAQG